VEAVDKPQALGRSEKGVLFMSNETGILNSIGNTPLIELCHVVPNGYARIFVKLESHNPTGSMKDRMARAVVAGAVSRGELLPNGTVIEYTGGSTGTSLAFVCAAMGYRLSIVTSDAFSREKRDHMRSPGPIFLNSRATVDAQPRNSFNG
jgi:cysteine synthase A